MSILHRRREPRWLDSEEWAFRLRQRRGGKPCGDAALDTARWRGEMQGALLLAVVHMALTCSGRPATAWDVRQWLTDPGEEDADAVAGRLLMRMDALLAALSGTSSDLARLRHAWAYLSLPDPGCLPGNGGSQLPSGWRHARWLLDAELAAKRGGLPPYTLVRVLSGPAAGRVGEVYGVRWPLGGGPPAGYVVRMVDCSRFRVDADMVVRQYPERVTGWPRPRRGRTAGTGWIGRLCRRLRIRRTGPGAG